MLLNAFGQAVLPRAQRVEQEFAAACAELAGLAPAGAGAVDARALLAAMFSGQRLAVFASLAELHNMPAVARAFGITQPAISALVRELEAASGWRCLCAPPKASRPRGPAWRWHFASSGPCPSCAAWIQTLPPFAAWCRARWWSAPCRWGARSSSPRPSPPWWRSTPASRQYRRKPLRGAGSRAAQRRHRFHPGRAQARQGHAGIRAGGLVRRPHLADRAGGPSAGAGAAHRLRSLAAHPVGAVAPGLALAGAA
jgi:hypothetical protein